MPKHRTPEKQLVIIDTNVLIHDPSSLYRFQEHDIFLPMTVLEELDNNKRGHSEIARNARQASRFIEDLMGGATQQEIENGIQLPTVNGNRVAGKLFFQTRTMTYDLPSNLPGVKPDNTILATALALQTEQPGKKITLVSKDINMRIKAAVLGIHAEDYHVDQVLDDLSLLYTGYSELSSDFWDKHSKELSSWKEEGKTFYRVTGPEVTSWYPNQFVYDKGNDGFEAVVRSRDEHTAVLEMCANYRHHQHAVWGITARNREQNFALNLLLDPAIDFVTVLGNAGTGKTLLTLAAGLTQVLDLRRYHEIIVTRATVPMGEDIGFLPGTEEEKMIPWMGALTDNLDVLSSTDTGEWGQAAAHDLLRSRIKVHSLNFMRGRTFLNKFVIVDEAQNLTSKQMRSLITRAGPGTKFVCLGNIAQIDTPYLTETTSGLTYVVDHFKSWQYSGHVTLASGERSRLTDFASSAL